MLSWIVLIAILLILIIVGTWAWSSLFGRFDGLGSVDEEVNVLRDNRNAVKNGQLEKLSFDVVSRGYRQDQVDDVIAALEKRLSVVESKLKQSEAVEAEAAEAEDNVPSTKGKRGKKKRAAEAKKAEKAPQAEASATSVAEEPKPADESDDRVLKPYAAIEVVERRYVDDENLELSDVVITEKNDPIEYSFDDSVEITEKDR